MNEQINLPNEEDYVVQIPERYNEVVKLIAGNLNAGLVCYLNPDTLETDGFPGELLSNQDMNEMESGISLDELNLKYTHWEKCITIEPLETNELFRIMEKFADQFDNSKLRTQLVNALYKRKPFANFKKIIDNSTARQDWFNFKDKKLQDYVKTMIEIEIHDELKYGISN